MKIWLLIYDYKDWQDRLNMTLHAQAERNSYLLWKIQGSFFPPAVPLAQWVYSPSLKNARGCENDGAPFQVVKLGLGLSAMYEF